MRDVRLVRIGPAGAERPAVLVSDDRAVDVGDLVGDFDPGFWAGGGVDRLRAALADREAGTGEIDLAGQRIGPPVPRPGKIICIGLNYRDHAAETGAEQPAEPVVFFKAPNALHGPYDDVWIPRGSRHTDWEAELGVVIGATARYLPDQAAARAVVGGYCISHDLSERAWQLRRGGQWVKGKSCETFNPLGPWLVTADEVPDPQALSMRLSVNGETMQDGHTSQMIFPVAEIVHYLSQFMVLEPGDLINTGTPAGIGNARRPRRFLAAGDRVELAIPGLGQQRATCQDAP